MGNFKRVVIVLSSCLAGIFLISVIIFAFSLKLEEKRIVEQAARTLPDKTIQMDIEYARYKKYYPASWGCDKPSCRIAESNVWMIGENPNFLYDPYYDRWQFTRAAIRMHESTVFPNPNIDKLSKVTLADCFVSNCDIPCATDAEKNIPLSLTENQCCVLQEVLFAEENYFPISEQLHIDGAALEERNNTFGDSDAYVYVWTIRLYYQNFDSVFFENFFVCHDANEKYYFFQLKEQQGYVQEIPASLQDVFSNAFSTVNFGENTVQSLTHSFAM